MRDTRYDVNDTIVAISSPPSGARAIVRLTGPDTITICNQIFSPACSSIVPLPAQGQDCPRESGGPLSIAPRLIAGSIAIDNELEIDAHLYLFLAPHSYTGDDVAEIHLFANPAVTEAVVNNILKTITNYQSPITNHQIRMAGPGEFTARAYLNGKIDLAQAEAVNEIVVSSNTYQLAAAEKLLSGRLGQTTKNVRSEIIDCLSLIEAGLDFTPDLIGGEDIEFITRQQAAERLTSIKQQLEQLLTFGSYEAIIDLPAVGIAGAPNAGKSSLLNKLLGQERSIISDQRKTTRDVLTGQLSLAHCNCVLFDCAGLTPSLVARRSSLGSRDTGDEAQTVLDELAQQAAIEALRNSSMVVFCVDISKTDWSEDLAIRQFVEPKILLPAATKSDLLSEQQMAGRLAKLNELFSVEFLPISVRTGVGLKQLQEIIDKILIDTGYSIMDTRRASSIEHQATSIALTARHRQAVTEAIESTCETIKELKAGDDEIAAMMLRAAYQSICALEAEHVDEQILERIFSRFCIGK